jgi:N-acetyl-beta-hexosaminidase
MKMAFIVHNEFFTPTVMELLNDAGIDYYTRWEHAQGKGHGTEPNVGRGGFASTNVVLMIGFPEDAPLANLIKAIAAANQEITRPSDRIRLFQLPLERIV